MSIKPLGDRVLVQALSSEKSKGGIIIPDTVQEKPQEGKIIAVGPGRVEKGDKVLFGKYAGTEIMVDNKEYLILRESDILAVL